jgi:hypothetical protein
MVHDHCQNLAPSRNVASPSHLQSFPTLQHRERDLRGMARSRCPRIRSLGSSKLIEKSTAARHPTLDIPVASPSRAECLDGILPSRPDKTTDWRFPTREESNRDSLRSDPPHVESIRGDPRLAPCREHIPQPTGETRPLVCGYFRRSMKNAFSSPAHSSPRMPLAISQR